MWQPNGSFQTRKNSISRHEIHVLVVDHDRDYLMDMATQLRSCSYKVTTVESGRVAMSMLTKRKQAFDLLLADTDIPDLDVIKLLQVAVHLELPSILMSDECDKLVAEMAVNNGAILLLQKPFTKETTRNFWQYVMKERTRKLNTVVPKEKITEILEENGKFIPSNIEMVLIEKANQNDKSKLNGIIPKRTPRKKYKRRGKESDSEESYSRPRRVKRKASTEWTEELHARFVAVVNHLGDGRCYPKEILDLMKVPGLTRMQVASHLQKCRNDNWRAPNMRKYSYPYLGIAPTLSIRKTNVPKPRQFGSMPKKRITDDTLGREMHTSSGNNVQSLPNPSPMENQSIEHEIQVTLPLPQSPIPNLPPPLENVNPKRLIPTPSPLPSLPPSLPPSLQPSFAPPLENVNSMRFMPTPTLEMNVDMTSSNFVTDTNNVPPAQQEFGASMDTSSFNQGYDFPAFSDFSLNGEFLPELMDGLVNNINGLPEPSLTTYPSTRYQQFVDEFTNVLNGQNATMDTDTSGFWNTGTSNTFDQP